MASAPKWLSAHELRSWMALTALLESLPAALDAQLKRDGGITTFDYLVLAGLSESPRQARTMSDLAIFATSSLSRLSHALDRLDARGWLHRRPLSGRQVEVQLTDAGRRKVTESAPGHVAEVRRLVLDVLTPGEVEQLGVIASKVLRVVAPDIARHLDDKASA